MQLFSVLKMQAQHSLQRNDKYGYGNIPHLFTKSQKLKKLYVDYLRDCSAMKDGDVLAVAPPGWSEAKMKRLKKHVGTTSAFKLAWYMHNKKKKK